MARQTFIPVVLCLSGHDPSGGAGIQADIEAIHAQDVHPATVVTAMTVQDSCDAYAVQAVDSRRIIEQARCLLADLPVAVIKLGLLGSADNTVAIATLLNQHPEIPVVLDPVLRAGGGAALADQALVDAIVKFLLPLASVLTPNLAEARLLAHPQHTREDCARELLSRGARQVLITGGDETDGDEVLNTLHNTQGQQAWRWPRLPHRYHGSGCTLAACLAARLARAEPLSQAVETAQRYTWQSLRDAYCIGHGQFFPKR